MTPEEIKALMESARLEPKIGLVVITATGPTGESEKFVIRDASQKDYYRVVDALMEFVHELGRREV